MIEALICDANRTHFDRYGGGLAHVRPDNIGAIPLKALLERTLQVDWTSVEDIIYGNANQVGEDNHNVARMTPLLAGPPTDAPDTTVNRHCGSGIDATSIAARTIKSGETDLMIAGSCVSMSRALFVMGKAESAFSRNPNSLYDTTIGWRSVNKKMKAEYGINSMPATTENAAEDFDISSEDKNLFAFRSQQKTAAAMEAGIFKEEIVPVVIPQRKGDPVVDTNEHPHASTPLEGLAKLKAPFSEGGGYTMFTYSSLVRCELPNKTFLIEHDAKIHSREGRFVEPSTGPVLANDGMEILRFAEPVGIADTIQVHLTCKPKMKTNLRNEEEQPTGVVCDVEVKNQEGNPVALNNILTQVVRKES